MTNPSLSYGQLRHANHAQLLLLILRFRLRHLRRHVEELRQDGVHAHIRSDQVGRELLQHVPPLPIAHLAVLEVRRGEQANGDLVENVFGTAGAHLDADKQQQEENECEGETQSCRHTQQTHGDALGVKVGRRIDVLRSDHGEKPLDLREDGEEEEARDHEEETHARSNLHGSAEARKVHLAEGALPVLPPLRVRREARRDRREVGEEDGRGENERDHAGEREEQQRGLKEEGDGNGKG